MELLRDKKVDEQFHKLVKNFLARNPDYNLDKFIGGLPVTLERGDMSQLMSKGQNGKSKYTVTQKVDGTRVLMYIGPDMETSNVKQRVVSFVDRNMKIYTIRDSTRDILPYVNSREMLLDGELVFFDQDGNSHKELESRYVRGVSFMAFDILFGPENINISTDGSKLMGQEFSMTIPEDGKARSLEWKYINRYDILHKLIIPSNFNKNEPVLTMAFKSVNWFNIELKPIYYLDSLKSNRIIYNNTKSGYLQTLLSSNRKTHYNYLMSAFGKQINVFIKRSLKLDGLIFTADDTLYTIGSWDKFLTVQYKWKPVEEQTVDVLIKKVSNVSANVYISRGGEIQPFQINYRPVTVNVPADVRDNSVAEFSFDASGNFIFKEVRKDKNTPNALRTVLNVINSFKNPVNINDIYYFLNLSENSSKSDITKVLQYSSKTKLLQCVANHKTLEILTPEQSKTINDMIKNVGINKETEVEMRFGKISRNFNPKIRKEDFLDILRKLRTYNFTETTDDLLDIYSKNIRTRYIFSRDFNKYILLESIVKNRISNMDVNMSNVLNFDVRTSLSSEIKVKEYNTEGDTYRKYRISFTDPNKLFKVDLTAITEGSYVERSFILKPDSLETFQVEVEFLSNKIDINNLFKFFTSMLSLNK